MKLSEQGDGENVGPRRPQQYRRLDLVPFDSVRLRHELDAVLVDRVGDLMAQRSRQLLSVLDEVEQRVHDIDIATRCRKGVRLGFVDDVELERVGVA
jgi:hypothetical protein